ncbi:hypothetical protein OJF2_45380 [Aquisphaera giovannonii]|uniref:MoxR-vWA-beta-propeller ternary system domain-containing protein n=2 Tax=Aquisphaera giovannonii TaxID=406548 RepID=A0A5B9W7T2_9BACT|nr:hypothetical protein OJF2_45380 [Aquisphaera giovannonii]
MRVDDYLAIPEDYGRWLGGLRWGEGGEVVEYAADDPEIGLTFALNAEVALFLEGVAARGGFPHFAFVLHFLHLLGFGSRHAAGPGTARVAAHEELARAFRETGRSLRNAGALCAVACRDIPAVADPPRWDRLQVRLKERAPMGFAILRRYSGEEPPLGPEAFDARARAALREWSADELRHWLRHGTGPIPRVGDAIARALPVPLAEAIAALEDRPRLKGVGGLVAHLDGALALPPRSLTGAELPLGGYNDVANRGLPEHILPGQLALDPDEFLRRFAARELLYYHREEPHAPSARELVLVLDQGVRTWGDVRLVLAAAAVALARQGERRGLAIRLATTGDDAGPTAIEGLGVEALGEVLESSDLSPNPGSALARALHPTGEGPVARDVVLLTHPRSLTEADVLAASRAAVGDSRLFAVAADAEGEVGLSEFRGGAPVAIARCRVNLEDARSPRPEAVPAAASPSRWRGDVEPIGFPFSFGAMARVSDSHFAFDDAGDWLLLASQHGLLHAWRADGSASEMLPRARAEGQVLDKVHAVVGVAGGFLVVGTAGHLSVAAHYDWRSRTCTATQVDVTPGLELGWHYFRQLHSVVGGIGRQPFVAFDLGKLGRREPEGHEAPSSPRESQAMDLFRQGTAELVVVRNGRIPPPPSRAIELHHDTGEVAARDDRGSWHFHVQLSEGRRELAGGAIVQARWNEQTLALLVGAPDGRRTLYVFSATRPWRLLGEFPCPRDVRDFAMSRDGRRIAWRQGERQIACRVVGDVGPPSLVTPRGRSHPDLKVELGPQFLTVQAGRHAHLVRWDRGPLQLTRTVGDVDTLLARAFVHAPPRAAATGGPARDAEPAGGRRFVASADTPNLKVAVDRFGQVAILDRSGEPACMLLVFRDLIAAWSPDGTRIGPIPMLGGPPTPGGEERIGAAIRAAAAPRRAPR